MLDLELKTIEHSHVENDLKEGLETNIQLRKSRLDELSIARTLWVFRRAVFYTFCVYTGFLCEGFEVRKKIRLIASFVAYLTAQRRQQCRCQRRIRQAVWKSKQYRCPESGPHLV
jgi:hypothetical protein